MLISTFLRRKGKRRQYCSSHQRVMKLILLAGLTLLLAHSSIRAIIVPNPVSQWSLILRYTNIIFSHISKYKITWVIELWNFFTEAKGSLCGMWTPSCKARSFKAWQWSVKVSKVWVTTKSDPNVLQWILHNSRLFGLAESLKENVSKDWRRRKQGCWAT